MVWFTLTDISETKYTYSSRFSNIYKFVYNYDDFQAFPGGSAGKGSACNAGDLGSIPGLGRFPGEGKGYPLQYSGLENPMNYIVHGVAKSQTRMSDFHFIMSSYGCHLKHNFELTTAAITTIIMKI